MIGTNNVAFDSTEDIYAGILAIIDKIKKDEPDSKLVLLAILPRNPGEYHLAEKMKSTIKGVNEKLSKLEFPYYYDYTDLFLDQFHLYSDHVHLNEEGYKLWIEQLMRI